ncbi:hypothetical protein ACP4OV_008880 [Aristida adscensionis]
MMACSKSRTDSSMMSIVIICFALIGAVLLQMPAAVVAGDGGGGGMHHLHFYMHEKDAGPNSTAVVVVNCTGPPLPAGRGSYGCFGDTRVVDDVLTAAPDRASRAVGRVQGMHVMASRESSVLFMSLTVVLTDYPPYTGSTVVVVGRNDLLSPARELPVVGGTGSFRMAAGYALFKTKSWSSDYHDVVLELDVFVRA